MNNERSLIVYNYYRSELPRHVKNGVAHLYSFGVLCLLYCNLKEVLNGLTLGACGENIWETWSTEEWPPNCTSSQLDLRTELLGVTLLWHGIWQWGDWHPTHAHLQNSVRGHSAPRYSRHPQNDLKWCNMIGFALLTVVQPRRKNFL